MKRKKLQYFLICSLMIITYQRSAAQSRIIKLKWDDVVQTSLNENLGLKYTALDYQSQKLSKWQAVSDFLPSLTYQGVASQNLELSTMTLMGQKIQIGTEYNYQHTLELSYPIFTGFSRIASLNIQRNQEKSLKTELKSKEDDTVISALEAYFQIMLSDRLIRVNQEALDAASANLDQVKQFFQVGVASELDLKRAETRYSSTLPSLESAKNQFQMAQNQLKYILNLSLNDSLVVLDSLESKQLLNAFSNASLDELKTIALKNRWELKQSDLQLKTAKSQKTLALSQALPTLAFSADVSHVAMTDEYKVGEKDYTRSKSMNLVVQWPLFQGGKTALETQKAQITIRQMEYIKQQTETQVLMDVEQCYYAVGVALKNLSSLKASLEQAREAFRLSNLTYKEGISTQVEVLDAQLAYTQTNISFQQGLYDYNISQLNLLNAIGQIETLL
jgi:outer membrane protein